MTSDTARDETPDGGGDAVRTGLSRMFAELPTWAQISVRVVGLLLGVVIAIGGVAQFFGLKSAAAMAGRIGLVWGFVIAVVLVVLLGALATFLLLRGPKSRTPPQPEPEPETGAAPDPPVARPATAGVGVRDHTPHQPIVGRRRELTDLARAVEEHRVVTVWGTGGVGKTRLCEEFLGRVREDAVREPVWVDLYEAHNAADIANGVASELGQLLPGEQRPTTAEGDVGPAVSAVGAMLAARPASLIVLDNMEHLQDSAPPTVASWVRSAPNCRFVVTSREPLGLSMEKVLPLDPLPDPGSDVTAQDPPDAVRLFHHRAVQVAPGFVLDTTNIATVAAICRAVDGLPWAIEVAAANLGDGFGLDSILRELRYMMTSNLRDADERHRSADALVDWSLDLLPAADREYAVALSAFPGSFPVDAVADVCGLPVVEARELVRTLHRKRLVRAVRGVHGTDRFAMYAVVRMRCAARWTAVTGPDDQRALAEKLADHYVRYLTYWNEQIDSDRIAEALDRLEADYENATQVAEVCLDRGDGALAAGIAVALTGMLRNRRKSEDRVPRLVRCATLLPRHETALRTRVLLEIAVAHDDAGSRQEAVKEINAAVAEVTTNAVSGPVAGEAFFWRAAILTTMAGSAEQRDTNLSQATADLDRAEKSVSAHDDPRFRARLHRQRAHTHLSQHGACADVGAELDRGERILEGTAAPRTRLLILFTRLDLLQHQGDYTGALGLLPDAQRLAASFEASYFDQFLRERQAYLLLARGSDSGGDYVEAATHFAALVEEARAGGDRQRLMSYLNGHGDALVRGPDELRRRRNAYRAVEAFEEAVKLAEQLGADSDLAIVLGNLADLQLEGGDPAACEPLAQRCLDLLLPEEQRAGLNIAITTALLARAKQQLGSPDAEQVTAAAHQRHDALPAAVRAQNTELRHHMDALAALQDRAAGRSA